MDFSLFDPALLDRIGVCGFVLYVVNYTLLTVGWSQATAFSTLPLIL